MGNAWIILMMCVVGGASDCARMEECVYGCGRRCAEENAGAVETFVRCRGTGSCEENAYLACVDACHEEETALSCAELASARCHLQTYGLPEELRALATECSLLVQVRDSCLAANEAWEYNLTTGDVELRVGPAGEPAVAYATPARRHLKEALDDVHSLDTEHLDELIFLLDLYCWGDACDDFQTHRREYDEFLERFGGPQHSDL